MIRHASPASSSVMPAQNARLKIGLGLLACVLAFQVVMTLPHLL